MKNLAKGISRVLARLFPTRTSFEDGSYIEWFNREAILYVEPNGWKMELPWMFRSGHAKGRVLQASDIDRWDVPHEKDPVSPDKKTEIRAKVVEYCRKRNIPLEIT